MTDPNTTTKVESATDEEGFEESEDLLSLESLDSIISEEDPEFSASLQAIGPPEELSASIYDEGLAFEYTLDEEVRRWSEGSELRKKVYARAPFVPHFIYGYNVRRSSFRLALEKEKIRTIDFFRNIVPNTKSGIQRLSLAIKGSVNSFKKTFAGFSKLKKVSFVVLLMATVPLLVVAFLGIKGRLVAPPEDLFIGSLAEISDQNILASEVGTMESFYDSPRISQNILLLRRMVVNLQRSENSGPNPMGAFEFYLEGTGNDVLVEIKDREAEVEDLFARTAEELNYDQIESAEGKRLLCDRLRKEVNRILTQGMIRKVFLKTAIIKP